MGRIIIKRVKWGRYHYADAWDGVQILRDYLEAIEEDLATKGAPAGFEDVPGNALWDIRQALGIVSSIINDGEHQTDAGAPERETAKELVETIRLLLSVLKGETTAKAPEPETDAFGRPIPKEFQDA